jgi:hypothetical protein
VAGILSRYTSRHDKLLSADISDELGGLFANFFVKQLIAAVFAVADR